MRFFYISVDTEGTYRVYASQIPAWVLLCEKRAYKTCTSVHGYTSTVSGRTLGSEEHKEYLHSIPLDGRYSVQEPTWHYTVILYLNLQSQYIAHEPRCLFSYYFYSKQKVVLVNNIMSTT